MWFRNLRSRSDTGPTQRRPATAPGSPAADRSDANTSTTSTESAAPIGSAAQIDPAAVMQMKNLQLRAKVIVDGFFNGLHRSPLHGSSIEFSEYRAYSPGDDPRGLDWKLFARTDRYFIKKFEDETNRRCFLVVDQSRSMDFGSLEYTKLAYARTLAATLAYFLTLQRDHVGLMTFDETIADVIPPRSRAGQFRHILGCLDRPASGRGTRLAKPLRQIAALTPRRGLVICLSDALTPIEEVADGLSLIRSRGHEVVMLRILDPAETRWQLSETRLVVDMETGQEMPIDPDRAVEQYLAAFQRHAADLQSACDAQGVALFTCRTDQPLQAALSHFVQSYGRRGASASLNRRSAQHTRGGR